MTDTFREPLGSPVWKRRGQELAAAMGREIFRTATLMHLASQELNWSADQTRQVLAAVEGELLFEKGGCWRAVKSFEQPQEHARVDDEERYG